MRSCEDKLLSKKNFFMICKVSVIQREMRDRGHLAHLAHSIEEIGRMRQYPDLLESKLGKEAERMQGLTIR